MLAQVDLPDITILDTEDTSNVVGPCDDSECIGISAPSSFTGTVRVQAIQNDALLAATVPVWKDVKSAGSNVTMVASGLVTITDVGFRWMRLISSVVQAGGDVTFGVRRQFKLRAKGGG